MARKNRSIPEVNAGSMADIAFLLLTFFLVTTTMDKDKGISILLPPKLEEEPPIKTENNRNVLEILINSNDLLLVEGEWTSVTDLTSLTKDFITNNGKDPSSSESPEKAIVSLKNDRQTTYETYIKIQNELKRAYREVRDDKAMQLYSTTYDKLVGSKQKIIKKMYPQKISEAENKG